MVEREKRNYIYCRESKKKRKYIYCREIICSRTTTRKRTPHALRCVQTSFEIGLTLHSTVEWILILTASAVRKSQNGEMKKPPMLFLNLCTNMDLEKQKKI
jgi:hypothetical protein